MLSGSAVLESDFDKLLPFKGIILINYIKLFIFQNKNLKITKYLHKSILK
jgi:hypothetical protein